MATAVLAAHLVVAMTHGGPVAVPDVPGYLAVAQWIAGGLPPPPFGYHPGYGLLLSPLALMGLSPDALHAAALMVNGALAAGAVLLAAGLARTLAPSSPGWIATLAAVAAALHPSLTSGSRIAWTETLLVVLVLATALALATAARSPRGAPLAFALVGWLATIGASAHPRAAALAVAAAVASVVIRPGWRALVGLGGGAAVGATMTMVALATAYNGPEGGGRLTGMVDTATSGAGALTTISGQAAALAAGTAGLAIIGLVEAIRRPAVTIRWSPIPDTERAATAVSVLLALGAGATLVISGASLAGSDRADTFAYGRYIDPYAVALVVLALATFAVRRRSVVITSLVIVVAATAIVWSNAAMVGRPAVRLMVASTDQWWWLSGGRLLPALLAGTAAAVLGLLGWLIAQHRPAVAPAPLLLFFVLAVAATASSHRHLASVGDVSAGQATTAALIRDMGDAAPGCLAHDRTEVATYVMWLYRMQLPATEHRRAAIADGEAPCSELVVAHLREGPIATCADATLLGEEPVASWGLWHVPEGACR